MSSPRPPPCPSSLPRIASLARVVLAILCAGLPVRAADDEAEVRQRFERGVLAEQQGQYELARRHYLAAYELLPNGPVAANLGFVEARLELWTASARHLRGALDQELPPATRPEVERALEQVLAHVGELNITVSPESALVTVDDQPVARGAAGRVAYVEPGMVTIRAMQVGFAPVVVAVPVGAGQRAPVRLLLQASGNATQPPASAPAPRVFSPPPSEPGLLLPPEALVAVGGATLTLAAAGLGTGAALGARARRIDAERIRVTLPDDPTDSYCYQNSEPDCVRLGELVREESRRRAVARSSFVVAGGLAASTVAAALVVRRNRRARERAAWRLHPTPTSIAATVAF